MLACGITTASSQSFTGNYAIFVGATPLWDSGASHADLGKIKFKIWIDNALQKGDCDAFVDVDNGWICKSSNQVKAGKHAFKIAITMPGAKKPTTLRKTLVLKDDDKKFEYPDKPASGEQFWCVSVSTKALGLMDKTDERCHTD